MARELVVLFLALALAISALPGGWRQFHTKSPANKEIGAGYFEVVKDGAGRVYTLAAARKEVSDGDLPPLKAGDRIEYRDDGASYIGRMEGGKLLLFGLPVDINEADTEDLVAIPGIGEKTAASIVEFRERAGRFRSLDELTEVRGIGRKRLENIRRYITL